MGVPGFYRWAVRRVPKVRQDTRGSCPHEFDNVYLDFNGVVHGCIDAWAGQEQEDILFGLIEAHLELLLTIVRPLVLLYIALDGVAPRAKMNQQRSRRFRAGKEAEARADTIEGAGRGPFDRNAVTPGTSFMKRLIDRLEEWAAANAAGALLQAATVVISGDRDPGEGEHKIMDIIRHHPERTHCLHSNDADLVFLGLVSPADSVTLLREKPQGRGGGGVLHAMAAAHANAKAAAEAAAKEAAPADAVIEAPEATDILAEEGEEEEGEEPDEVSKEAPQATGEVACKEELPQDAGHENYELLSIVAIRHWLAEQFPEFDCRRLAADFVAMCCLAGNDFLPHLAAVDIYSGGLDKLVKAYSGVLRKDGHLVMEDSSLFPPRWRGLFEYFADAEAECLFEACGLGLGQQKPAYQGPPPPSDEWDGLSILATRVPARATADDVRRAFSKQASAVQSVHELRKRGPRGPTAWLVRFEDPAGAVSGLVHQRRLWGQRLQTRWTTPTRCDLLELPEEPFVSAPFQDALAAEIVSNFEFWFSEGNLRTDCFLRRHIRSSLDRFVPLKVFTAFNRMKLLCQDIRKMAMALQASPHLEVKGEGNEAAVRAVQDYSVWPEDDVELQRAALAAANSGDFIEAVHVLGPKYYASKSGPTVRNAPALDDVAGTERFRCEAFLVGIEWVTKYYVRGCSSWSWFYPAHYPPLCTSFLKFMDAPLAHPPLEAPWPPELQLLAVLPPQSAALLPKELQRLLVDATSPIAEFYPRHFEVDLKEGDKEWQGIVLLPFVDESRLRAALDAVPWDSHSAHAPARAFLSTEAVRVATDSGRAPSIPGAALAALDGTGAAAWDFSASDVLAPGRPRLTR